MTEIRHRQIETNGISMHIAEAGPDDGPLVVMVHGFPELWYSWRHQLPALAEAGYHAVAPDVRGYGDTDKPHEIEAYAMREMIADIVGILDALSKEQAVVIGHDWGAPMAWNSAALHPERFRAVVGVSIPYLPRSPMPPLEMLRRLFKDRFFYMLYFQEPGDAEEEFESDVRGSLLKFIYYASGEAPEGLATAKRPPDARLFEGVETPSRLPEWLSEEDLSVYVSAFERSGFRGPLNRYRCLDLDWEQLPELQDRRIEQPAFFIGGQKDGALSFSPMEPMDRLVPDLRGKVILPGCGHWTQQERPEEVNREILGFLRGL